ncbi:hypothetical protein [Variovorax sp.]|uniref:hypothetical protein n=1 Tax=Variovorax sp. TaxID=1871043 RepID=UPI0025EA107C|nr:hypothetical protein [Variovorax sp.]
MKSKSSPKKMARFGGEYFRILLGHDVGLQKKASLLVSIANDNGGRDNISVVLARAGVVEPPRTAK